MFTQGYKRLTKWSEQERIYRCRGDDRLFDKIIMNAEKYEKSLEEAEK